MLNKLYTTQMSTDKEKLKARLENIQRTPNKKHTAVGLLVTLVLVVALTAGTLCLAAVNREAAPDLTMTDEEFAVFLDQPWGAVMASLDYANEEILVFHYNNTLCVADLTDQFSFRYIFDLRELNITTTAQSDIFLQVDVAQDGSMAYLSTGGMSDLATGYDTYLVDLATGQVEKGKPPTGTDFFRGQKDTFAAIPDVAGWASQCITVDDRTYYLNCGGSMVRDLQLVTHYTDGSPDQVWYLFGEPPYEPTEEFPEDIESSDPIADSVPVDTNSSNSNSNSGGTPDTPTVSDPPLQQTGHFNTLAFKTGNYLNGEFSRTHSSDFKILEQSLGDWEYSSENEGTFLYTVTYAAQDAEDQQEPLQMTIPMKVTRDEDGQLTLYRDTSEFGGQESTGPEWTPADVESMMTLP
ncbi:MAG: hypothetical protein IKY34_05765 [Ruminiclostridium sp.]|nr:hypothetical protein [Ruminiclostridium sp.]